MKFPKVTARRFVIVASVVFAASTAFFHFYTSVAPLPHWLVHSRIPEWFLRYWPLGSVPMFCILTWFAIRWGIAQLAIPPGSEPIQYPINPRLRTGDEYWGWANSDEGRRAREREQQRQQQQVVRAPK
jgi:hypothetical protein